MLYRKTTDEQHYIEYRRASNRVKTEVRMAVRYFERQRDRDAKANPKALYKYTRSKMKTCSAVADVDRLDGTMSETDVDIAEVFNTFFTGVFTLESLENIPTFENRLNRLPDHNRGSREDFEDSKDYKTTRTGWTPSTSSG